MTRKLVAIALALVSLAACGTRLPDKAFESAGSEVVEQGPGTDNGGDLPGIEDGGSVTTLPGETSSGVDDGVSTGTTIRTSGGSKTMANQASDIGITPNTIRIGSIVAEEGVLGDAFAPAAWGIRAWAARTNATGGIAGRKIELFTCNDREDRTRALECAQRLVERDRVFALLATNTRALGGAAEYLDSKGIPVFGIPITNSFYRYPHFYAAYANGYKRDGKQVGYNGNLVYQTGGQRWFRDNLGITKAAVFNYDIAESKQFGDGVTIGLEKEGYTVKRFTVSFAAPAFDQAVAEMQAAGTQIIFDGMDDGANRRLCDSMERRRFKVKAKVSTIVSMGETVGTTYNDTCRDSVYIQGASRAYSAVDVPAVKTFRDAFARYQPGRPVHQWALEAFAMGEVFAESMRGMGPTPTRAGFEKFLMSMRRHTQKGLLVYLEFFPIDYSKTTTEDCFSIAHWDDAKKSWVEPAGVFPICDPNAKQYGFAASELGN